jgi:hypothetical protein
MKVPSKTCSVKIESTRSSETSADLQRAARQHLESVSEQRWMNSSVHPAAAEFSESSSVMLTDLFGHVMWSTGQIQRSGFDQIF